MSDNTGIPINVVRLLINDMPVNVLVCLVMFITASDIYVLGSNNLILQFLQTHRGSLPALVCNQGHCTL